MALTALRTRLAVMFVVLFVAAETVGSRIAKTLQIFVTRHALQRCSGMCITQGKLGAIVLKPAIGVLPVPFGMAICALFTKVSLVLVIFFMAPEAVFGSLFKHGAFVAGFALFLGVLSQKWKARSSVVKLRWLFPAAFAMATTAVFA